MEASVLREYDEWLADHMEELVRQYPSKVVAVYEGQVIYTGDSVERRCSRRLRNPEALPIGCHPTHTSGLPSP